MDVYKHWSVLDHIPDGWVVDRYAGSPLHGHVFVTNGKNLLTGQQLRALAPDPQRQPQDEASIQLPLPEPDSEPDPEPPRPVIDEDYRLTMNNLARKKTQEKLLQDILTDMHICKLEGWSHRDYLIELKNLIDGLIDKQSL
jgi:hypothetical protein